VPEPRAGPSVSRRLHTPAVPSSRFLRPEGAAHPVEARPVEVVPPPHYKVDQLRSEVDAMVDEYKHSFRCLSDPLVRSDVYVASLSRRHADALADRPWGEGAAARAGTAARDSLSLGVHAGEGRGAGAAPLPGANAMLTWT